MRTLIRHLVTEQIWIMIYRGIAYCDSLLRYLRMGNRKTHGTYTCVDEIRIAHKGLVSKFKGSGHLLEYTDHR